MKTKQELKQLATVVAIKCGILLIVVIMGLYDTDTRRPAEVHRPVYHLGQ